MGIDEDEEIQANGVDNLLNNIIAESFPNIEKRKDIQVQEAYRTPNPQNQK
jgi:hypothetical protein